MSLTLTINQPCGPPQGSVIRTFPDRMKSTSIQTEPTNSNCKGDRQLPSFYLLKITRHRCFRSLVRKSPNPGEQHKKKKKPHCMISSLPFFRYLWQAGSKSCSRECSGECIFLFSSFGRKQKRKEKLAHSLT